MTSILDDLIEINVAVEVGLHHHAAHHAALISKSNLKLWLHKKIFYFLPLLPRETFVIFYDRGGHEFDRIYLIQFHGHA